MNPARQLQMLRQRRMTTRDCLAMMRENQVELARAKAAADIWGVVAIMANVTLIPLNCIVNAYGAKTATSLYQALARELYSKFGKSGTRIEGPAKTGLSVLKQVVVHELKRKGLTSHIPGVNILVGLAEDSMAAMQAMQTVDAGGREMAQQVAALQRRITALASELQRMGIREAELIDQVKVWNRTA